MHYSSGLEYVIGNFNTPNYHSNVNYFSKNIDDKPACENAHTRVQLYEFRREDSIIFEPQYAKKTKFPQYKNQQQYSTNYAAEHSFIPEICLKPSRPKSRFVDDNNKARRIAEETFELMLKEKMPSNISINILPFDEFKALHSRFGAWSNGILGFSINNDEKKIFVRENHLDSLMLVIGHEIGHVLTDTLPNKHDEEAKAFAFSIEWAKTIKEHNIANLGLSIKEEIDFQPARNGLHDFAFEFVDFMVKRGRRAIELHDDLARRYVSIFDKVYC